MTNPAEIFALPRRHSLAAQSVDALRQAIARGAWAESLPSERRLCELLQVSRPTIRRALRALAGDGLIEIRQGRRIRLLKPAAPIAPSSSRLVLLVSQRPIPQTSSSAYQGISEMRADLAAHGFTTEELVCPQRGTRLRQRKLESFLRENAVVCCVLLSVGKELQEWCAARSIPALVLGSCHPAIQLPSLDVDYRAVCRHAAIGFRRQGHRRIALLVPDSGLAGDLASEDGFREGCQADCSAPSVEPVVLRHAGSAASVRSRLNAACEGNRAPTALLVAKPDHTLAAVTCLLRRGLRVPADVSLICRDWDHLFEDTLSHYRFDEDAFTHRLSRLMLELVDNGRLPAVPHLIFPRYVSCGTSEPAPR